MTRARFPAETFTPGFTTTSSTLRLVSDLHLEVFLDQGCTVPADILDADADPLANVEVVNSELPDFYGPDDGTTTLYVRPVGGVGQGAAVRAQPATVDTSGFAAQSDLDALTGRVDDSVTDEEFQSLQQTVGQLADQAAVTGSRADGSALASLLTVLASKGIITDSTSA